MPSDQMTGGISFCSVYLSVGLFIAVRSTLTFTITFELQKIETNYFASYSTNYSLCNDTRVNTLVTLTVTFLSPLC